MAITECHCVSGIYIFVDLGLRNVHFTIIIVQQCPVLYVMVKHQLITVIVLFLKILVSFKGMSICL